MSEEEKVVPGNVSLYPEQWDVVEEVDQVLGLRNRSAAMRRVVDLAKPHVQAMVRALREGEVAPIPSHVCADADLEE